MFVVRYPDSLTGTPYYVGQAADGQDRISRYINTTDGTFGDQGSGPADMRKRLAMVKAMSRDLQVEVW